MGGETLAALVGAIVTALGAMFLNWKKERNAVDNEKLVEELSRALIAERSLADSGRRDITAAFAEWLLHEQGSSGKPNVSTHVADVQPEPGPDPSV